MKQWFAEHAWLGHPASDVLLETDGDRIVSLTSDAEAPRGATRLPGLLLPGMANAHSHAFHRGLRGRGRGADFWEWREDMYRLAHRLNPESYHRLARAVYGEMSLAGITAVGEFHYLHHDPSGRPYSDPNAMGEAVIEAARDAGIRITLLDTCYLRAGFDRPAEGVQVRFSDGLVDAWADRVGRLADGTNSRVGAAVHSVRAVDESATGEVASWAAGRGAPLFVHVSEQPAENEECIAATGLSPTELLDRAGVWAAEGSAVHATHLTDDDIRLLGRHRSLVCFCPTTERALGDGIGPSPALVEAGARICVGTDSHAQVDVLEEARLLELHQRLLTGRRGFHSPESLISAATTEGMSSLGWDAGRLEPGRPADFVAIALDSPRTAGYDDASPLDAVVAGATAADVRTVVVGGKPIVDQGRHVQLDVASELSVTIGDLLSD